MSELKNVYEYIDYREFLKNRCAYLKKVDKKYSQRYFMQKLGVKSTGFFFEMLCGKRNLNHQNILSFIKILKLDRDEAGYFENLVYFNQARSIQDKDHWLLKMMESSKVNSKILNRDVYEYFSKWYFAAIRELLFFCPQPIKPQAIADMLCPPISRNEAQKALALLEKLELIRKLPDGTFMQKDTVISTGDLIRSVEIANYQLQTIDLAKHALDATPVAQRDISTLTMSISKNAFEKIVDIIKKAKQDIIKVTRQDSNEDRVYQLNMQFFPLTKSK
jgi:uncharacterized protein (TIGR02147 family)